MNGASYQQLAFEFGVTHDAAAEARRRFRIPPRHYHGKKSPPADLAEVVGAKGVTGARLHYSVGWSTLRRWIEDAGVPVDRTKRYGVQKPREVTVPADWAEIAPTMFKAQLAQHYGISHKTVNRIIEMSGVQSKRIVPKPKPAPKPKTKRQYHRGNWRNTGWRVFNHSHASTELRTMSTEAARFLRRFYPNVHRCDIQMREGSATTWGDEHGVPNRGKGWYRVGPNTMTELDMVNHALARGMDA